MTHPDQYTAEARALTKSRQQARHHAVIDPLAKREKTAAFWVRANASNPAYGLVHTRAFYSHPGFRPYLMPRTRAFITARHNAHDAAWREVLRRSSAEFEAAKALKAALKKAGPMPLFEGVPA